MIVESSPVASALNREVARTGFPCMYFPFGGAGDRIMDQMAAGWRGRADVVNVDFAPLITRETASLPVPVCNLEKPLLIISGSITSPLAPGGHAVAVKIDRTQRSIFYHDSYGAPPPAPVAGWLREQFPDYTCRYSTVKQQHDHTSCSWMRFANITAWLQAKPADPDLQQNLDGFKLKVLQAMRPIWPELAVHAYPTLQDGNSGRIRIRTSPPDDPKALSCFQHLTEPPARLRLRITRPANAGDRTVSLSQ